MSEYNGGFHDDQADMADSFLEDTVQYSPDTSPDNQDQSEKSTDPNATTAETQTQPQEQQPVVDPNNQQQQPPQVDTLADPNPTDNTGTPDLFESLFNKTNDQGNSEFNPLTAEAFMTRKDQGKGLQYQNQIMNPEQKPPEQPNIQPAQTPELSYGDVLNKNLLAGFDMIADYVNQGYSHEQAAAIARQSIESDINNHLTKRELDEYKTQTLADIKTESEKVNSQKALDSMRPDSTRNLHDLAKNGYGSIDNLKRAIFDPNIGGKFFMYMHDMANPDLKPENQQQYVASMDNWFVKLTSNKEGAAFIEDYVRAKVSNMKWTEMIAEARNAKGRTQQGNVAGANMGNPTAQLKPRTAPTSNQASSLDAWINDTHSDGPVDHVY